MMKILFICHGNICRSPMAEFICKDLAAKRGIKGLTIASAATSNEEIGNPVYPPAKAELKKHGISCEGKRARRITAADYREYDLLICMDSFNIRNALRIFGEDKEGKLVKLMSFANSDGDVADPWYTDRFDIAYSDIYKGCCGLLDRLSQ
ncbi:MAG: low molecular weight phosphotyrosine protein phosphatase [Clostridia bacterium]|nr:low molecular weight phosphotyrosine protein phosphatase [Clostridia bacterium]